MKKQLGWIAVSAVVLIGCAQSRTEGGTDGATHWLASCESSAECGELECLCGMCTEACEDNASCSGLSPTAQCAPPSQASCAGPAQICQRPAPLVVDDGGGDACRAMDARSNGTRCASTLGYAWDGMGCKEVVCGCTGADCAEIYETLGDCERATSACTALSMCIESSDCALVRSQCCQCDPITAIDLHAVSSYNLEEHAERVCGEQSCEACAEDPLIDARKRYVATCNSTTRWEGFECQVTDLARMPCTDDVGCRVRVARCCECGEPPRLDELFAVANDYDASGLFCDTGFGCCEAEPEYPANASAICGPTGYCALLIDGEPVVPGRP